MIKVQRTTVIERPIDEVFAYVGDQTNAPEWQSGVVEVRRTTTAPIGVGAKHDFVRRFMGRRMESSNEYVAYEPGRRITFRAASGPVSFEASYLFASTPLGTRLTSTIDMDVSGPARLLQPMMAAGLRREMKAAFIVLKDLLEQRAVAIPATAG
jgi:uncharacterized protein YndB with AHSA1/START domain